MRLETVVCSMPIRSPVDEIVPSLATAKKIRRSFQSGVSFMRLLCIEAQPECKCLHWRHMSNNLVVPENITILPLP